AHRDGRRVEHRRRMGRPVRQRDGGGGRMSRLATLLAGLTLLSCSSAAESPPVDDSPADGVELPDGRVFTRRALLEDVAACVTARTAELATLTASFRAAAEAAEGDPAALGD